MPGLIIDGVAVEVPGLVSYNWLDNPKLRLKIGEDGAKRPTGVWVRAIVLHTTLGIPGGGDKRAQTIHPGKGPSTKIAAQTVDWWSKNGTSAGAHVVIDHDGTVYCLADLSREMTYHATSVNAVTVGVEIAQRKSDAGMWEAQFESVAIFCDFVTSYFGIQRQIHWPYRGFVPRMAAGGKDCVGVYGHRDQTNNRGAGDPGDAVMLALKAYGYEAFDFAKNEDLEVWKHRQVALNNEGCNLAEDGFPGPQTCAAVEKSGRANGLWVAG